MKLQQVIAQYVSFRQAIGEDFSANERVLKAFSRAMGGELDISSVTLDQVGTFLNATSPVTNYWHRKQSILNGFYRYALSRGHVAASPLPREVPKRPPRFVPYIYSSEELRRLLNATTAERRQARKLEPHTFHALLLVLYAAGLRLSEALSLTLADVDLPGALITLRDSKFYKTRLVPLGPQLQQALAEYATQRQAAGHSQSSNAPFFVGRCGTRLLASNIQKAFCRLRAQADVSRADGARYGPRLHDLRHSFAVHRLIAWYQEGADVQKLLPQLSTYLGHINIAATQVYLTMTPELLSTACARFEQYAFKEVSHD